MPTINDSQFDKLRSVTDALEPISSKLTAGDSSLTGDEMTRFTQAYKTWRDVIDTAY